MTQKSDKPNASFTKTLFAAFAAAVTFSSGAASAGADNMVIAMPQLPTIIEPQGINNNAIDRCVSAVFETLVKADQTTGELKPGLAESWKRISPDTVEFKLRPGVKFHDGTPMTADDVVFSFGPERFSGERARDAPRLGSSSETSRKW